MTVTQKQLTALTQRAENHLKKLKPKYLYHCYAHSMFDVGPTSIYIATEEGFDIDDIRAIGAAGFEHETGFLKDWKEHEKESARIYRIDCEAEEMHETYTRKGELGILSTDPLIEPLNDYGAVLKDADLASLGRPSFFATSHLLRMEWIATKEHPMHEIAQNDRKWYESQIAFLTNHKWYTRTAIHAYTKNKEANLARLETLVKKAGNGNEMLDLVNF